MEPVCPRCGRDFVQRTHREGLLELLLSVVYVYPFRCQLCAHRFQTMQWGKRYVKGATDKRQYQRLETRIPATFSGDQIGGTGVAKDISAGGCGLELAAEMQIPTGTLLELQLRISDQEPPVIVEAAAVRAARGKFLGVQFLRIQPQSRERLSQFIRELMLVARR